MVSFSTKFSLVLFFSFSVNGKLQRSDELLGEKYIKRDDVEKMRKELEAKGDGYGEDWIYMPDGEGTPQVALLRSDNEGKLFGLWENTGRDDADSSGAYNISEDVHFFLYTRSNSRDGHSISPDNPQSLRSSLYDGSKPTKMVIHGWKSAGDSSTVLNIKDAYLKRSDVNVIGVDWSNIASNTNYFTPMGQVPNVGGEVARMIDLVWSSQGARRSNLHVIGHSLGAHVAGAAALKSGGKVSRVTGLDPALPGFQFWQDTEGRLDSTDAEYVDVIHTCGGVLGMTSVMGHADFYPNGGTPSQPGCCCLAEFTAACSHGRAHQYFAESIINETPFVASECPTWDHFESGQCGSRTAVMGENISRKTRGVYYLLTNSTAPYSLGPAGSKYFEQRRK